MCGNDEETIFTFGTPAFWIDCAICICLVGFAAIMSGLTMALMSLDSLNMHILEASGTEQERRQAAAIAPLLKNRHLLLVTLLVGNATAMEALPIFLDRMVPSAVAVLLSVTFVLIFGEIIPQAVFTKWRLPIGAALSPLVWGLQLVTFPISWPIAKVLDLVLGEDHPTIYRRAELKELTKQHAIDSSGHGTLTEDEVRIMQGTLDLADKKAADVMTRIDEVKVLDMDCPLNLDTLHSLLALGHSRLPVFLKDPERRSGRHLVGILIVKNLISVDPDAGLRVRDVSDLAIRLLPTVKASKGLFSLMQRFRMGYSHMALVVDEVGNELGIVTMEDVIEELLQVEILDEKDDPSAPQATLFLAEKLYKHQRLSKRRTAAAVKAAEVAQKVKVEESGGQGAGDNGKASRGRSIKLRAVLDQVIYVSRTAGTPSSVSRCIHQSISPCLHAAPNSVNATPLAEEEDSGKEMLKWGGGGSCRASVGRRRKSSDGGAGGGGRLLSTTPTLRPSGSPPKGGTGSASLASGRTFTHRSGDRRGGGGDRKKDPGSRGGTEAAGDDNPLGSSGMVFASAPQRGQPAKSALEVPLLSPPALES